MHSSAKLLPPFLRRVKCIDDGFVVSYCSLFMHEQRNGVANMKRWDDLIFHFHSNWFVSTLSFEADGRPHVHRQGHHPRSVRGRSLRPDRHRMGVLQVRWAANCVRRPRCGFRRIQAAVCRWWSSVRLHSHPDGRWNVEAAKVYVHHVDWAGCERDTAGEDVHRQGDHEGCYQCESLYAMWLE